MAHFKTLIVSIFILSVTSDVMCKIVLPHKLRYLENMLNSEVVAKAARIRQRMEANPSLQSNGESWPVLLAKYGHEETKDTNNANNLFSMYDRRAPNFKYLSPTGN